MDKDGVVDIYAMEYYSAIKEKEIMPFGPKDYHTE